jgi:hypothetical protein
MVALRPSGDGRSTGSGSNAYLRPSPSAVTGASMTAVASWASRAVPGKRPV